MAKFLSFQYKVDISKVSTLCALLESLIFQENGPPDPKIDPVRLHPLICTVFVFCYAWAIGGNLVEGSIDIFDSILREMFQDNNDIRVSFLVVSIHFLSNKNSQILAFTKALKIA